MRLLRLALGSVTLVLLSTGCNRAINSMTASPEFRKGVVEKGRSSCMASANDAVKVEKTPQVEAMLTTYCNCVADKGLAQFSNSDLINIGVKGIGNMTPDQKTKFDGVVSMCQAEAFPK